MAFISLGISVAAMVAVSREWADILKEGVEDCSSDQDNINMSKMFEWEGSKCPGEQDMYCT